MTNLLAPNPLIKLLKTLPRSLILLKSIQKINLTTSLLNKQACYRPAKWTGLFILPKSFWHTILTLIGFLPFLAQSAQNTANTTSNNSLKNHPSAYLAMHAQDPVHWQDWSGKVLQLAQRHQKPILISSGYFACHWCHVMQHENYQDSEAARLMNRLFINVKLDRELHPDLDDYLIDFSRDVSGKAGWPQHVLLTPQGYPFAAFGYLENQTYKQRLRQIGQLWSDRKQTLQKLAKTESVNTRVRSQSDVSQSEMQTRLKQQLAGVMDDFSGGLKGTLKFPMAPLLLSLLQNERLSENQQAWLQLTLDQMQSQHLIDHVHGGFYRYTVDPEWQVPHFEKMAYDNALLAQIYFLAAERWQNPLYLETAITTLDYLHHQLWEPKIGLFKSSQSALDLQGREGGAYLFTRSQLKQRLSKAAYAQVEQEWKLKQTPPYALGWHPRPTQNLWPEIQSALRTPKKDIPSDHKYILSWNALILSAYVTTYEQASNTKYLQMAESLGARLQTLLSQTPPPRALDQNGQSIGQATLEDYAYTLQALKALQKVAPNGQRQAAIKQLNQLALDTFYNANGWRTNVHSLLPGLSRKPALADTAIPSATAIMSCLNPALLNEQNRFFADSLRQDPIRFASYLSALECKDAAPTGFLGKSQN
ncbi:thioredoxin domain-containing protein [Thiomicrorhabdus chilensis]|uniref:thioredoxin domain-containing protein n=1 Tax=Thiomicrorhabdus chilensis TaxID=63656 RepID=UPI000A030C28|nr:DUF255 domain-containing protein [Thiomicrorhabdus chilensis]